MSIGKRDYYLQIPEEEKSKDSLKKFTKPENFINTMKEAGFPKHANAYERVLDCARIIAEGGGRALLVGGSVRDTLMGKIPKDFDLEIYGLEPTKVEELVQQIGKVSDVGKSFGILKIFLKGGLDIDISLPRTNSKINAGHRGFEVKTDPHMSIEDAARRRDFTMNSIAANPLTGELYDPFGGVEDIKNRILKITDPERFKDDPLRVLRALQFIGRFGLEIDKDSMAIIQEMATQLKELPKERIGEEWKKLLLKSEKPSLGLSAAMILGVFREIHPEFLLLTETQQEKEWHPEGDVWIHTLMTIDQAAKIIRRENLENDKALTILLSALCHDLGKPIVTKYESGRIISHGHETAGKEPTKKFLTTIGIDNLTRDKVLKLVTNHLIPTMFYIEEIIRDNKISDGAIRRLAQRIHPATIQELVLVSEADHLGRGPFNLKIKEQLLLPEDQFPAGEWLLKRARALEVEDSRPADLTRGKDWINLGYEQGESIGRLIELSNALRDEKNFSREILFKIVDGINDPNKAIEKLKSLLEKK